MRTINGIVLFALALPVYGDQAFEAITHTCDAANGKYQLKYEVSWNSPWPKSPDIIVEPGEHKRSCRIGSLSIDSNIRLYQSSGRGECGGVPGGQINSLRIGGKEVLKNIGFNNCFTRWVDDLQIMVVADKIEFKYCGFNGSASGGKCFVEQHTISTIPQEPYSALNFPYSKFEHTEGGKALYDAADRNELDKAIALIKNGAPVDSADDLGRTPLVQASFMGHINMVKLLLDSGASVNGVSKKRMTPLMSATVKNHDEIVSLLLERKANPNIRTDPLPDVPNDKGVTALSLAQKLEKHFSYNPSTENAKKNKRIIELLTKAGAVE